MAYRVRVRVKMGEVTAGDVTAIDVIQENSNSNEMLMKGWAN